MSFFIVSAKKATWAVACSRLILEVSLHEVDEAMERRRRKRNGNRQYPGRCTSQFYDPSASRCEHPSPESTVGVTLEMFATTRGERGKPREE
jgi:hypothetical protein